MVKSPNRMDVITENSGELLVEICFWNSIFAEKTLRNELKTWSSSSLSFFQTDTNFQFPISDSNLIPLPWSYASFSRFISFSLFGNILDVFLNNSSLFDLRKRWEFFLPWSKNRTGIIAISNAESIKRNLLIFITQNCK